MNVIDKVMKFLVGKVGLNLQGAQILTVRGRKSGEPRSLIVNPLERNGTMVLLSARGDSGWVQNIRAAGECTLHRGSTELKYAATEIHDDAEKLDVMRAYLRRWGWQVKSFMHVDKTSSDDELRAILANHPMFALRVVR